MTEDRNAGSLLVVADQLTLSSARGRIALTGTVAASGMASLDATVVNVALPHIGDDLGGGVGALQWVLTGYLLTLASLILLAGALGDRYGRRRIFVIGTVWFALASLLCGAAPNLELLIVARLLQGVGAALLTPGSLAILQASFREEDRARAVGAWSGLGGVAGALGPFVGGWLVDGPGWRWAFLINVPVAVLAITCAVVAMPETRDPASARRLDVIGAAIAVVTLGAMTWTLTESGGRGWSDPTVVVSAVVAVAGAAWFVRRMLTVADPLVPPSLFASRAFVVTNLQTVLLYAALGVAFFQIAYALQVAAGWTALAAGVALLPTTLMMLVGSARSGDLATRLGPRPQLVIGPVLTAVGLVMLTRITPDAHWVRQVLPGALLLGLGLVSFVAPLTATVMGSVSADHVGLASGVNNAIARTAGLAALSIVPVVSGLTSATDAASVATASRVSLLIAAVLALLAAPIAFFGLREHVHTETSARRTHCPVDGPPLQSDTERVGAASQGSSRRDAGPAV